MSNNILILLLKFISHNKDCLQPILMVFIFYSDILLIDMSRQQCFILHVCPSSAPSAVRVFASQNCVELFSFLPYEDNDRFLGNRSEQTVLAVAHRNTKHTNVIIYIN